MGSIKSRVSYLKSDDSRRNSSVLEALPPRQDQQMDTVTALPLGDAVDTEVVEERIGDKQLEHRNDPKDKSARGAGEEQELLPGQVPEDPARAKACMSCKTFPDCPS